MRNATPLKPCARKKRSPAEVARWRRRRAQWIAGMEPASLFHRIFDHIPGVFFFAKDRQGHTMFASRRILELYRMRDESEMLGLTDFDINPGVMAAGYVREDGLILRGKSKKIERIELWFDRQGAPDWFLVTKLPLLDKRGRVAGVMGLLRRPAAAEYQLPVFETVAKAVEIIRRDYAKPLVIADLATICGQSLRQLQRRFQAAFGLTPQEFLIKARVLAAIRLLEETSLTAGEIAARCGFIDQSSFTQHFRARIGMTPARYRNRR